MVAIFAAPAIAAWFYYFNPEYLPEARSNRGELISPVVPLPAGPGLTAPDGTELAREPFEGRWTLVFLASGDCAEACLARVADLRQIRLALGESGMSVERLLVIPESAAAAAPELEAAFPGMRVAVAGAAHREQLTGALGEGAAALGRVYILDPMGNLMMRYAPDAPAKDTLKDMERLLKASKNWIKGAQYGHR
jgi:cytochrome oxidase Cu insertion factor (SCO1/SenC/PrrC family)